MKKEKDEITIKQAFQDYRERYQIDDEAFIHILSEVLRAVLSKRFTHEGEFDLVVNVEKGDLEMFHNRVIVEDDQVNDPKREIALSEARMVESDFEVGEDYTEPLDFSIFGRREILALRQQLNSKVQEYVRSNIFQKYKEKQFTVIRGEVKMCLGREYILEDYEAANHNESRNSSSEGLEDTHLDRIELLLPKTEIIPGDRWRKGDSVKALILKVEMPKDGKPQITLSRTAPLFLERLMEEEIPEVGDGKISIKKIVRQPGERAKVAVESWSDNIDPVGACVGVRGGRISGIVKELRGENIDVVKYSENKIQLIQAALQPARVGSVQIIESEKRAKVYMEPNDVSLAIGKGGNNIKLASQLCGYNVEVYRSLNLTEEDVDIHEFNDEIDDWVIDVLERIGCDTAKAVLAIPRDELIQRTDLEEETIDHVLSVLRKEFADEDTDN